jgi:hypothetical protein
VRLLLPALTLSLFACSSGLEVPADLGGLAGVSCGATSCGAPMGECCRSNPYGAGTCVAAAASCPATVFACDDPSDCPGQVCCLVVRNANVGSVCETASQCSAEGGTQACLGTNDCPSGQSCCGVGPSPSYRCQAGPCPL